MTRNAFTAFRLSDEMAAAIEQRAADAGKSRSAWLRSLVENYLNALSASR